MTPTHTACKLVAIRLLACALLGSAANAAAQPVYIWTDEQGIRHLSDRPPESDTPVEVVRALADPRQPVRLTRLGDRSSGRWQVENRLAGPVSVALTLDPAENVTSRPGLPTRFELPAWGKRMIEIAPRDPARRWRYRIQMRHAPGPLHPKPDHDWRYRVPLPPGVPFRISQGYGGQYSHQRPESFHAIDIPLPVGTPVLAARDGTVMDTERWFDGNGDDLQRHGPRANHVRVLHADGTMAVYVHLRYGGVQVRNGQKLRTGDLIGYSGNTGYSSGPHLHFAVQVQQDLQLLTLPFTLVDHAGRIVPTDTAHPVSDRPAGHAR
ncbi:MAG: peptidoglycan DD-metalloendopeptidase family protein [Wenzhouxiangellaceae bacterium]